MEPSPRWGNMDSEHGLSLRPKSQRKVLYSHTLLRPLLLLPTDQQSPTFLAPGTNFMEDNFSRDHGVGGLALGFFKRITFPVHFISNLMLPSAIRQQLAIWQQVPVCSLETGDPCWRVRAPLGAICLVLGSSQVIHILLLPTPHLVWGLPCSSAPVHRRLLSY